MKSIFRKPSVVFLMLFLVVGCGGGGEHNISNPPPQIESGQDRAVEAFAEKLSGQQVHYRWREGEVIYGTYYFVEVHYCRNGRFKLFGQSEKQTIEDNIQRNSWQNEGSWFADRDQNGQFGVYEQPDSGSGYFVQLTLDSSNRFSTPYADIVYQGRTDC